MKLEKTPRKIGCKKCFGSRLEEKQPTCPLKAASIQKIPQGS